MSFFRPQIPQVQHPHECLLLLRAAKMDFLAVVSKVKHAKPITKIDRALFLNYIMAVLLLKHLLRPSILEKITVSAIVSFMAIYS